MRAMTLRAALVFCRSGKIASRAIFSHRVVRWEGGRRFHHVSVFFALARDSSLGNDGFVLNLNWRRERRFHELLICSSIYNGLVTE
jgi:hypothetical protein